MANIEDKIITVGSLKKVHEHNTNTYMAKTDPIGTGAFSMNRKADTTVGQYSSTFGDECTASAFYSLAEGYGTTASGSQAHAEGYKTTASGDNGSHAEGLYTIASSTAQHVQGKYNIKDTEGKYAHIVGNGSDSDDKYRSNAHTLDWEGNAWFAGDLNADGNIVLSSNQYGNSLPAAGTVGRIFFKKLT